MLRELRRSRIEYFEVSEILPPTHEDKVDNVDFDFLHIQNEML